MARSFGTLEERQAMIADVLGDAGSEDQSDTDDELSLEDGDAGEEHQEAQPEKKEAPEAKGKNTSDGVKPEHRQEYDPKSKIPPQRWNQVLDERNSLRAEINRLKQSQEAQRQSSAKSTASNQGGDEVDREIERILKGGQEVPGNDPLATRIDLLEARQTRLAQADEARAVREEAVKLQGEVAEVQKKYPHIDKNLLYQAVAKSEDPDSVDLWEVAERWEALMEAEFVKRAKTRGLSDTAAKKDAKQQMAVQKEAPRPRASGSSPDTDYTKETVNLANPKQRLAYAKQLAAGLR